MTVWPRIRPATRLSALFALVLAGAAACSWFGPDEREEAAAQRLCPRVGALGEANHITKFRRGDGDGRDVMFEGDILQVRSRCEFDDDDIEVYLEIEIDMRFARGPAQPTRNFSTDYFLAVSATNGQVYGRDVFPVEAKFEGVRMRGALTERLEYTVVLPDGLTPAELILYVGYVLTPQEIRFNRRRKRSQWPRGTVLRAG